MRKLPQIPLILALLLLLLSSGCASIYFDRSFIDQMEHTDGALFVAGSDFQVVAGDQSSPSRGPASLRNRIPRYRRERERLNQSGALAVELQEKESSLTDIEYRRYRQIFDKTSGGTSERIYYLSLSRSERGGYQRLLTGNHQLRSIHPLNRMRRESKRFPISTNQQGEGIFVGMNKSEVVQMVGPPAKIESAKKSSPRSRNKGERWTYYDKGNEIRHIYFEDNQVQGWNLD
jgi:hypothetical protein